MKARRVVAGLAATALVLVTGPAMASGNSYTVAVGGSSSAAQRQISASTDAAPSYWMEKPDGTFLKASCSSADIPSLPTNVVNAGTSVVDIAVIGRFTMINCPLAIGTGTVTSVGSWKLHGTSAATNAATDLIAVHLDDVAFQFSNSVCSVTVTGGLDGSFSESTQKLTIDEKADGVGQSATVTNVVGCLGQVKDNGKFRFQGTFSTTVAGGSVNIRP